MTNLTIVIVLSLAVISLSCKQESNDGSTAVDYHLTVGDTAITIPDSAVDFANVQFSAEAYILREYQVAHDPNLPHQGSAFTGTLQDWKALGWQVRSTYLLAPYAHDIKIADDAQYFYEIGTYFAQFGYGWRDTFDPEANLNNASVNIWLHPADTTLSADIPSTVGFDGESHFLLRYRSMWSLQ